MTMSDRLTEVGELERPDHSHLPAGASCFFWGEYTSGQHRSDFSPTNQLIRNFKKPIDRRGTPEWKWKEKAIIQTSIAFAKFFRWEDINAQGNVALIPMPPSRPRGHALFDSRMLEVLQRMRVLTQLPLDIRDCLSFGGANAASHESENRPTPDQLFQDLVFDMNLGKKNEPPGQVFIFDDMLTTGAHFVSASRRISQIFPDVKITGIFMARRVFKNPFALDNAIDLSILN